MKRKKSDLAFILIIVVVVIGLFAVSKKDAVTPSRKTQVLTPKSVGQANSCSASEIKKLNDFYSNQVDKVYAIAQSIKTGNITQSTVDKANKIAYDVIDFNYPVCAKSAHDKFERYATMMAVSIKFKYDGKDSEAMTALNNAKAAFDNYVAEMEKLKK